MSGVRDRNRREGDRSEYLATYILSAVGLVTQVPRQEDIGFDLICNIADRERGSLSFDHHYAVSVKSMSTPNAIFAPPPSEEDNAAYSNHFSWIFNLEIPLLLALVDKENQGLALYSTLPAWFLYHKHREEIGILELVPRLGKEPEGTVGEPRDLGIHEKTGGRKHFSVDLGFPIITLSVGDIENRDLLKAKKASLRKAIEVSTESTRSAQMTMPFFSWFNLTIPGGFVAGTTNPDGFNGGLAWFIATPRDVEHLGRMLKGISPALMSAALFFKKTGHTHLLNSMREVMYLLPEGAVPAEIKAELPELYPVQINV